MLIQFKFDGAVSVSKIGCDMGCAVAVFINNEYQEELSKFVGVRGDQESSSNVSEWLACVEAMKLAAEYYEAGDQVEVYSDSQLITNQFNGEFAIKQEKFRQYYEEAKQWANCFSNDLKINWIPRKLNKEADRLSKIALKSLASGEVKETEGGVPEVR